MSTMITSFELFIIYSHPRPTSKPPSKNNLNDRPDMITSVLFFLVTRGEVPHFIWQDGRNNGAAVFIAFFVLMLIQVSYNLF